MGAKKDPKKDAKTPSKTPKKKEGGGGKAKKKKWSKGKTRYNKDLGSVLCDPSAGFDPLLTPDLP